MKKRENDHNLNHAISTILENGNNWNHTISTIRGEDNDDDRNEKRNNEDDRDNRDDGRDDAGDDDDVSVARMMNKPRKFEKGKANNHKPGKQKILVLKRELKKSSYTRKRVRGGVKGAGGK